MTAKELKFPENEHLFPPVAESSRLLVACRRADYSASRIARAVEDCDAHLLNLNVTDLGDISSDAADAPLAEVGGFADADASDPVLIDLRVSHRNPSAVARSLERYDYSVILARGASEADDDTFRERIEGLLRYLDLG